MDGKPGSGLRGNQQQTLTEEFFGDKDVAAVTIYPNLSLQPNQSTDVLIMTKRGGN